MRSRGGWIPHARGIFTPRSRCGRTVVTGRFLLGKEFLFALRSVPAQVGSWRGVGNASSGSKTVRQWFCTPLALTEGPRDRADLPTVGAPGKAVVPPDHGSPCAAARLVTCASDEVGGLSWTLASASVEGYWKPLNGSVGCHLPVSTSQRISRPQAGTTTSEGRWHTARLSWRGSSTVMMIPRHP